MIKPSTTRLSTKGQVVIPEEIRQRLGLEPGDRFAVIGEGDVVILKALQPIDPAEFEELLAKARASAKAAGLTLEDVEAAIAEVRGRQ